MKRVRLGSSAIATIAYDEEMRSLDVGFRGGDTYRYFNVSKSIYRELLKAESAGAYWNEVKDKFAFVKLN